MKRFLTSVQALALALGAPGLFLITFLDSSFLSFPEATDLLLVWMVTQHTGRALLYVSVGVAGSVAGCLVLFLIGQKGGEALVRSRFDTARVDRALAAVRRHGIMAVFVPTILPPPMPFKIFVLLAGVAEIATGRFILAIVLGRGIRYGLEAALAIRYGTGALEFIHGNLAAMAAAVAGIALAGLAGYVVWTKSSKRGGR